MLTRAVQGNNKGMMMVWSQINIYEQIYLIICEYCSSINIFPFIGVLSNYKLIFIVLNMQQNHMYLILRF